MKTFHSFIVKFIMWNQVMFEMFIVAVSKRIKKPLNLSSPIYNIQRTYNSVSNMYFHGLQSSDF